jgi:hypothetical protein
MILSLLSTTGRRKFAIMCAVSFDVTAYVFDEPLNRLAIKKASVDHKWDVFVLSPDLDDVTRIFILDVDSRRILVVLVISNNKSLYKAM